MLHLRILYQWLLAFLLFVTFSSFSGDCMNTANFTKPQTEVVVSDTLEDETTAKYCDAYHYKSQQVTVNHFTVFNFESLLNWCHLKFSLTLKTQKQKTFEFLDTNSILEQNLIAYKFTSPTYPSFVK